MESSPFILSIVGMTMLFNPALHALDCEYTLKNGDVLENKNIILQGDKAGVCAVGVANVTIRNINFISTTRSPSVYVKDSSGVSVENNTFQISGYGARIFWFDGVKDSVINSNRMLSNGESHLLRLDNSDNLSVTNNTFTTVNDGSDNVRVFNTSNSTFDGNTFNTTKGYGFLWGDQGQASSNTNLTFKNNIFNGQAIFWAVNNTTISFVTDQSINNVNNTNQKSDGDIYGNQGTAVYKGSIGFKN